MQALVLFTLDNRDYALPVADVQSVIRMVAITPLPPEMNMSQPAVMGAINVHGTPTAVIDVRQRLNLPPCTPGANSPLMLVRVDGTLFALLVDKVSGVVYG